MNLEDFTKKALENIVIEEPTLYKLIAQGCYRSEEEGESDRVDVYTHGHYFFPSKEEALAEIDNMIRSRDDMYRFILLELPYGCDCNGLGSKRSWLYDSKGEFVEYMGCSTLCRGREDEKFYGRTPEQNRFKCGAMVEIVVDGCVEPGLVIEVPPTPERALHFSKINCDIPMDIPEVTDTDFCGTECVYRVASELSGDKMHRLLPIQLLPLSEPISDKTLSKLESIIDKFLK